jgi:hypothetical protein
MGFLMIRFFLHRIKPIALVLILFVPTLAKASIVIVANIDEPITLSKSEVRSVFMGRGTTHNLKAVGLSPENKARAVFNARVVGMTEARVQSYWAQMRFSGRQKPPIEFRDETQVLNYLLENERSVAYLDSSVELKDGLVVVYSAQN